MTGHSIIVPLVSDLTGDTDAANTFIAFATMCFICTLAPMVAHFPWSTGLCVVGTTKPGFS